MTVEAATIVNGSYTPAAWHPDHRGMDFNGTSFCFIGPQDFASPGARELDSPCDVLEYVVTPGSPIVVPNNFYGIHAFFVSTGLTQFPYGYYAKWVRSHDAAIAWADLQPINKATPINWTNFDRWLTAAEAIGATPIYVIMTTPTWASSNPTQPCGYNLGGAAPPTNPADLTDFLSQVIARYGSRILYWECRNEVNILPTATRAFFWSGTTLQLADEVKSCSQLIKASIPSAKIIAPSTVGWGTLGGGNDPTVYTPLMLTQPVSGGATVLKDWVDLMSTHLYYFNSDQSVIPLMVQRVRAAMATAGISSMPLIDTESGILDAQYTYYTDERYLKTMLRHTLLVSTQNMISSCWYAYDGSPLGLGFNNRGPEIYSSYQALIQELSGATINKLVQVSDGTLVGTYTKLGREYGLYL